MGVTALWQVLAPVKEQLSTLEDLRGKCLAVDLSGWICQFCKTRQLAKAVEKPHLSSLFHRLVRLYADHGASLLFVVDGDATRMKWATMDKRVGVPLGGVAARRTGVRRNLNRKQKECCELLEAAGVPYVESQGEAEATCALLNHRGIVDGVITEDSDAFLYGALVVYKQLSTSERDARVERYSMRRISSQLGLTRHDLIAMAVMVGCDYMPQGVPGVGKEMAMKVVKEEKDMIRIFQQGELDFSGSPPIVRQVLRKTEGIQDFFDTARAVISEYLSPADTVPMATNNSLTAWKQPDLASLQRVCSRHMQWELSYSREKGALLLIQWVLRERREKQQTSGVKPLSITSQRVHRGTPCYQVDWLCSLAAAANGQEDKLGQGKEERDEEEVWKFSTLERICEMQSAFPEICSRFEEGMAGKKRQRKGGKGRKEEREHRQSHGRESNGVLKKLASLSMDDDQSANSQDGGAWEISEEDSLLSVNERIPSHKPVSIVRLVPADKATLPQAGKAMNAELLKSSCANHYSNSTGLVFHDQHSASSPSWNGNSYGFGSELLTPPPPAPSGSSYGFGLDSVTFPQGMPSNDHDACCGFSPTHREMLLCDNVGSDSSDLESLTCKDRVPSTLGSSCDCEQHSLTSPHHSSGDKPYRLLKDPLTCPYCAPLDSDSDQEIPPLQERMKLLVARKPGPVLGSGQHSLNYAHCISIDSDSDQELSPLKERMNVLVEKKLGPPMGSSQFPIIIND